MENNNKESYALLEMCNSDSATDEPSDIVIAPQRKKRLTKHKRHRAPSAGQKKKTAHQTVCGGHTISMTLLLAFLFCWFITLTWLAVVLNSQIRHLDTTVQTVVAGSQGVPDALQKCHSLSKELQQNQTSLFLQVTNLAARLANFSIQVTGISSGLSKVEERFKTSPELINVPQEVQTLKTDIATFGSQIEDLITTVSQLKESNTHLAETAKVLQSNITTLKQNLSEISVPVRVSSPSPSSEDIQAVNATLDSVRDSLAKINSTLSEKLQWAVEDQSKDHKSIVVLQDTSENVSARVTTLQNECQAKSVQLTTLTSNVDRLSSQVNTNDKHWNDLMSQVNDLSNKYSFLQANTTDLQNVIEGIKKNVPSSSSSVTGPLLSSQRDEINNSSTSH